MTPRPVDDHQRMAGNLYYHIRRQLESTAQTWVRYESDWIVNRETTVAPDLMVGEGHIEGDYLTYAPALIIEVLSSSTESKDRGVKYRLYQEQGVATYIMVDPARRSLEGFELREDGYQTMTPPLSVTIAGMTVTLDPRRIF